MSFNNEMNKLVKKMDWVDLTYTKLGVFAFALMVAKLWSPILSLDWYWYLILAAVFAAKVWYKLLTK